MDTSYDKDPLLAATRWHAEGLGVAMATVVRTWGSAPRQAGSQMSINERGEFVGSVSGGCVETAVMEEAGEVLQGSGAQLLTFGVSNDQAWEVGLACGGEVQVHLQRVGGKAGLEPDLLGKVTQIREDGEGAVLATDLATGTHFLWRLRDGTENPDDGGLDLACRSALETDRSTIWEDGARRVFLHVLNPPVHIIIIGAVHIAQPLAVMARLAGFSVSVVDPREAFATAERFPEVDLRRAWPSDALEAIGVSPRSAIVTVTHDPKIDDPALTAALRSPAFYIGALGSRRTHGKRLERLGEAGFNEVDLGRIHAPIGLNIGAHTPGEIAISILAEIIEMVRTRGRS